MNFESFRNSRLFSWATSLTRGIAISGQIKGLAEMLYWRVKKWEEHELTNDHYKYFFTEYFGIPEDFYQGINVLDIGCGPRGSLEWAEKAAQRTGLDPLAEKYLKLHKSSHRMQYVKGGSESIPFDSDHFDVVSSFNSLDHVEDVRQSLQEIVRVLKPGGLFLLIVDIHTKPTITEPSAFSWEIMDQVRPYFDVLTEQHYEGHRLYKSIRQGIPYDHDNPKKRYGVLTAKCQLRKIPYQN